MAAMATMILVRAHVTLCVQCYNESDLWAQDSPCAFLSTPSFSRFRLQQVKPAAHVVIGPSSSVRSMFAIGL